MAHETNLISISTFQKSLIGIRGNPMNGNPIKMGDFSSIIFITHILAFIFLWNLSANRCLFSLISTFQKSLIGISGNPMYSDLDGKEK